MMELHIHAGWPEIITAFAAILFARMIWRMM